MDPLSLAASIAGVAGFVATVVSTTYSYGSSVIHASKAVKEFLAELQSLRTALQQLETIITTIGTSVPQYAQVSAKVASSVNDCKISLEELQGKLEKRQNAGKLKGAMYRMGWPLAEKDTLSAINVLARYRGQFQFALNIDTWQGNVTLLTLSTIKEYGEKQIAYQADARNQQLLDWISSFNYQMKHDSLETRRTASTGTWLINSLAFQEFSQDSGSGNSLWCRGVPGAGKTVMSWIVIDHLSSLSANSGSAVIYHYFDYLTAEEQSSNLLCGSFLKQLIQQHARSLPELENLHQRKKDKGRKPKEDEMIAIIISLLSKFTSTFIIVDAMDECAETYRNSVLVILSQLQKAGAEVFITSRPHIEPLDDDNDHWKYIEIFAHGDDIRRVFDSILKQKKSLCKRLNEEFREEIVNAIVEKAAGMFLWASLQITQILDYRTPTLIRRALEKMPSKIYDVFTNTLERIGDNDLARRTLLWLALTDEPLPYPALSHALAVDLEYPTQDGVDEDSIPSIEDLVEICHGLVSIDGDHNLRFVHFTVQEYFSEYADSLLPLNGLTIAQTCLSYLSFKDFESGYCDSEEKIERRLAQYPLYSFAARRWNHYVPKSEEHRIEDAILSIYAHQGLFISYAQARYTDWAPSSSHLPWECDSSSNKYFEFQRGYLPLHDAVDVGVTGVVRQLLSQTHEPSPKTKSGITPLHLAIAQKHDDIMKMLLDAGADKSSIGLLTMHTKYGSGMAQTIKRYMERGGSLESTSTRSMGGTLTWSDELTPVTLAALMAEWDIFDCLKNGDDTGLMASVLETASARGLNKVVEKVLFDCPAIDCWHPSFAKAVQNSLKLTEFTHSTSLFHTIFNARTELDDRNGLLSKILGLVVRYSPESVATLLEKGASVNGHPECDRKYIPLTAAFKWGNQSTVRFLIEKGANISDQDYLSSAVSRGMKDIVEMLLGRGLDVNGASKNGMRPLESAAKADNADMVDLLLDHGANIEARSTGESQTTALIDTGYTGAINAASVLVRRGANVNANSIEGTPIIRAAICNRIEYIQFLLHHGADISIISANHGKPSTALAKAVDSAHLQLCELLLSRGADPNSPVAHNSPLIIASRRERVEFIELLLKHGADPNGPHPALESAVFSGNDSSVHLLLNHGATLDFRGGSYGSVMHAAAMSQNREMVKIMLDHGAKIFEVDGDTYGGLLSLAHPTNHKILIEHGAKINTRGGRYGHVLQSTIVKWSRTTSYTSSPALNILEIIECLLAAGADVNLEGGVYQTALQIASRTGHLALVRLLGSNGAKVGIVGGRYGTALQAAAYKGTESVVEFLLNAGADVSQTGGIYHTALQAAAFRRHESVVKILLARKADVNLSGGIYHNALRAARQSTGNRIKDIVEKILLDCGAVDSPVDTRLKDSKRRRPRIRPQATFPNLSDGSDQELLLRL